MASDKRYCTLPIKEHLAAGWAPGSNSCNPWFCLVSFLESILDLWTKDSASRHLPFGVYCVVYMQFPPPYNCLSVDLLSPQSALLTAVTKTRDDCGINQVELWLSPKKRKQAQRQSSVLQHSSRDIVVHILQESLPFSKGIIGEYCASRHGGQRKLQCPLNKDA